MGTYRVIAPEGAYLNEGLREQGDVVALDEDFVFDKARDGAIIEPVGKKAAQAEIDADRTLTDAKISRDPRTDTGGTNDKAAKDLA